MRQIDPGCLPGPGATCQSFVDANLPPRPAGVLQFGNTLQAPRRSDTHRSAEPLRLTRRCLSRMFRVTYTPPPTSKAAVFPTGYSTLSVNTDTAVADRAAAVITRMGYFLVCAAAILAVPSEIASIQVSHQRRRIAGLWRPGPPHMPCTIAAMNITPKKVTAAVMAIITTFFVLGFGPSACTSLQAISTGVDCPSGRMTNRVSSIA